MSVFGDHRSHEDIIRVRGEVCSDFSLVFTIGSSILNGLPGVVGWVLHKDLVGVDANIGLLFLIGL